MYINSSEGAYAMVFVIVIVFFLFFDIKRESAGKIAQDKAGRGR